MSSPPIESFPRRSVRPAPPSRRGFTLLETILALGVTFMIVTAAFAIVTSCLELGDSVTVSRSSREEAAAVEDLFRHFFASLPPEAALEARATGQREPFTTEIRVQNAPAMAGSVLNAGPNEVFVIHTSEEPGGYLRLQVGLSDGLLGSPRPGAIRGFALAGQIAHCEWRFFRTETQSWENRWMANLGRPRFVELTFSQRRERPERWVFPVPVFSAAPAAPQNPGTGGNNGLPDGQPPDPPLSPSPSPP